MEAGIDTPIYIVAYVCSAHYVDLPTYKQIDDGLCLHKFGGWMYFQESSLSILLCLSYAIVPAHFYALMFFHLHIHIHFHIHVLSVVAVAVLIVIVVIVLQVEVDTTSWNSCIAACDWQIGFHLLRQMQDIKLERCAHTYRIHIYIYIMSHTCFVVHLYNYTNVYIIYLYLKNRSSKPGFAELQMLRFA